MEIQNNLFGKSGMFTVSKCIPYNSSPINLQSRYSTSMLQFCIGYNKTVFIQIKCSKK